MPYDIPNFLLPSEISYQYKHVILNDFHTTTQSHATSMGQDCILLLQWARITSQFYPLTGDTKVGICSF